MGRGLELGVGDVRGGLMQPILQDWGPKQSTFCIGVAVGLRVHRRDERWPQEEAGASSLRVWM